MNSLPPAPYRQRLSPALTDDSLSPFVRATALEDISLYWLPIDTFPVKFRQREWILTFLDLLRDELAKQEFLTENFLQLKYAREELNQRFTETLMTYRPLTGMVLTPGAQMPATPTTLEIKDMVENPAADGSISVDHFAPDYCCWFAGLQDSEQRRDFFGVGGMLILWLAQSEETKAPVIEIPRVLRTHPAMQGVDFNAQLRQGFRYKHPFLKRSKEVFAAHLSNEAIKRGAPFILPRLRSQHFFDATPEERAKWFEIFAGYCIESQADKGLLLALKDPKFDEKLVFLLEAMEGKGMGYFQ